MKRLNSNVLAVGCADLVAPTNGWIKRSNDQTVLTCNLTGQVWKLVCKEDSWVGPPIQHLCLPGLKYFFCLFQTFFFLFLLKNMKTLKIFGFI